jgi:hypothetical protein
MCRHGRVGGDGRVPASLRISCGYDAGTEREILISLSDFDPPTNSDKLSDANYSNDFRSYFIKNAFITFLFIST